MNVKYYALSMDGGDSFLAEIFEYDHDIPNFFEAVNLPMLPIVRDTWMECFEHMKHHLLVRTNKYDILLKHYGKLMDEINPHEDVDATEKLTHLISKIKYVQAQNEHTQDIMLDLVKLYGEKHGDVTQDMLEAVSFLSSRRKEQINEQT